MHRIKFVGGLLFCLSSYVVSSEPGRGVRSSALANAGTSLPADAWSVYQNPAQLGFLTSACAGVWFVPHQYGLSELRTVAVSGAMPLTFGSLSGSIERFGFDLYRESSFQVALGHVPLEALAVGVTMTGKLISIKNYGSRWVPLVTAGIAMIPWEGLSVGAVVRNVFGAAVGRNRERLPQSVSWGMTWISGRGFLMTADLEKDIRYPLLVRVGFERTFFETVAFRAGVSSPPRLISAGVSVRLLGVACGYAGRYHADLGWTHQIEAGVEIVR